MRERWRRARAPKPEELRERFSTEGLSFRESLKRVLVGGPDRQHDDGLRPDEREADK
jgi:hypothetical protein